MDYQSSTIPSPYVVSLREVAAWDLKHLDTPCEIKVGVPTLQRGLIWSVQQVELLWDSILRGFPVGSLVVCERVAEQIREDEDVTHHLLDGQQRCNAITLGFHDPFRQNHQVRGNRAEAILWLDLAPEAIPANSTREYLIRVTTLAHPWGFKGDDQAGTLTTSQMKESAKKRIPGDSPRPTPRELFPHVSQAPVPLSWLLLALGQSPASENDFRAALVARLVEERDALPWTEKALSFLESKDWQERLRPIYQGLCRAAKTKLVALVAPAGLASPSQQESRTSGQSEGISHIEHLFSRLNQQGTRLEGEELAYSLIKAYWPKVDPAIEAIECRRVPASMLAALAIRAALSIEDNLERPRSIPQIRALAKNPDQMLVQSETGIRTSEQRRLILDYLKSDGDTGESRLGRVCAKVDEWLRFDSEFNPCGLPPVLISSIARSSADIYLLMMILADRTEENGQADSNEWKRIVCGITTLVHWFGTEKEKTAQQLLRCYYTEPSMYSLRQGIADAIREGWIVAPLEPTDLKEFLVLPEGDELAKWSWWPTLVGNYPKEVREERESRFWPVITRTIWQREMLLYAQRGYIAERFPTYDPSRKDLWQNHNRPWDFDHIHASAYFYNAKSGDYAQVCREWGNCIGNLRAWAFEENRSDQKQIASEKLSPEDLKWSQVDPDEVGAFSYGDQAREKREMTFDLCSTIRNRYVRIYQIWYDSTEVSSLLSQAVARNRITPNRIE